MLWPKRAVYVLITICAQLPNAFGNSPYAIYFGPYPNAFGDSPYAFGDTFFDQPAKLAESLMKLQGIIFERLCIIIHIPYYL
jgi:hypothetical protein